MKGKAACVLVGLTMLGPPAPTRQQLEPDIRCFEDSVKVLVVEQVLPDNGTPPDVDWGLGNLTGQYFCTAADNLYILEQ